MNKVYIVNKYYNLEIELNFNEHNFIMDGIDYKFKLFNNILYIYWLSNEYEEYYTEDSYIYYSDLSLKNKIKLIYLIHNDWYDQAIMNNDNKIIKRIKNNDIGIFSFHIEESLLKVDWGINDKDEFIKKDDYTYVENKKLFSEECISKDKLPIYIFIHICCIENWRDIFIEQIQTIKESGLYDIVIQINLCILGNVNIINDKIFNDNKFNIIYVDSRIYLYEIMTINSIKSFCERANYEREYKEIYILYIHTKGVRRAGDNLIIKSWRNMMEYFLIDKFKDCLNGLSLYDTLGNNIINARCVDSKYANINPNHNLHYSGNFWWSKKSHIDKLDYIPVNLSKSCDLTRFKAENWILSNYPDMNVGVIFQDNTNTHPYYRYIFDYYKKMVFCIKKFNETKND